MDQQALHSKFRGALLGVAVGDALGAPFEGRFTVDAVALERLGHDAGHMWYTDDTHMTLGVAESLMERRPSSPATSPPSPGVAMGGPPQVFTLLSQGVPWDQAGRMLFEGTGSFGNGAAMRVAPVALLAFRDLDWVAELARQTALITHAHELGVEGAVLQACAIAFLLHQSPHTLESPIFLQTLQSYARASCYLDKLERLQTLLLAADRHAVVEPLGNGMAAYEAVPAALYAFLRYPDSFAEAVTYAISLGGDTDTIASMTGALTGAYLGAEAIPSRWRDRVEGGAPLRRLADALLYLATRSA